MFRSLLRMLACMVLGAPATVAAQSGEPVWRGTVGTAAIVLELDPRIDAANGRYFYGRYLHDIQLDGSRSGTTVRLHEPAEDDAQPAEWVLDTSVAGELRGEWIGPAGRHLPIRLSRFNAAKVRDPERAQLLHDDPYEYLRSATLRLKPGALQTVGEYRLQWFKEPRTQVSLFQVLSGYSDAERLRVNHRLRERHWKQVSTAMGCLAEISGDYTLTTTLHRIDATILSVSLFASYDCGGAHPDFGDEPLNVDPRTGRLLELEDVLWLGKGAPPPFEGPTQNAFFEYRDHVLGPWLARMMAKRYPKDVASTEADGCDYTDPQVWQFVSWYVRDDGLYVGPGFARAMRACEYPEWSVLPWQDVERHPGRVRIGPRVLQHTTLSPGRN